MAVFTVSSRVYFYLDRVSKLVGLLLLTLALLPDVLPEYSLVLGILGVLVGVATAFVDVDEKSDEDPSDEP
ncbi:hypothetical protein [Halospeciosus flavus]|uniref:DUF8120 domain-containing protein n=1 Tax=Halospeciosus flavus TaxID=3032283 RepID=A0ABD5Z6W1_9EURY|nr:hypothetical protein [Halospeciosus flavus]